MDQDVKEARPARIAEPVSSTRSITLDDLLGNSSSWKYYIGHDGTKRQDISGVEWTVLEGGKGKTLTQEMVSQKLRRYVIKGTFDLGGKTIKMPYGSVLDLESGDLRNGSLVFDDTRVTPVYAISKQTKLSKIKVSGTYYETLVDLWGASDEPIFPWDTTAPKKVYTVDLKKFGITPGYQKKGSNGHYSDKQYDLMYNNGVGFTNAIQWAYKNGYDGIRFPKNDYCFTPRTVGSNNSPLCAQVLIQDLEKFDIDLGGGSYYNILDSSRKSKYYKDGTEAFNQQSYMFWFSCCINVQIHNGLLIGDRLLRDYVNNAESAQESTYGIYVSGYTQNIRIHHIDASSFMGDGISISQYGYFFSAYDASYSNPGTKFIKRSEPDCYIKLISGRISRDTENSEFCTVSEYIDLSKRYGADFNVVRRLKSKHAFTINNNLGYTRIPNIYSNVEILTYNCNAGLSKPLRIIKTSYLDTFFLEPGETGVRIQCRYDEGIGKEGFEHSVAISDAISGNIIVEYCTIHDNHRGGISGGSNNNIFRYCSFTKTDNALNCKGIKIPLFTIGGTNYHIDFEDSYAKGLSIHDCTFSASNPSIGKILLGVFTFDFYHNVSDTKVLIYNNVFAFIHDNTFSGEPLEYMGWLLSKNIDNQKRFGCKYLTRISYLHDNINTTKILPSLHFRTILFSF